MRQRTANDACVSVWVVKCCIMVVLHGITLRGVG